MKKLTTIGALLAIAAITTTSALADGKAGYEAQCAKCHGPDAKGNTKMGQKFGIKDYSTAKAWEGLTDEKALKAVKEGVKDKDGKTVMKASEASDADAKAMVDYMKSLRK